MPTLVQRWLKWSRASVNRRILGTSILVGGFGIVVNLAVMAKDLIVAHQFGRGDAVDAFLIAFLLPSFAINIVAGSLNVALIPAYLKEVEKNGEAAAQRLISSAMFCMAGLLIVVSLILALVFPWLLPLVASNFGQDKLSLSYRLFLMVLPVLTISGFATLWAAILNARHKFVAAAVTPLIVPLVTIFFLVVFSRTWGIYSVAAGTVAGFALQCIPLANALRRRQIRLLPGWYGTSPALREVIAQYIPMIAGAFLMSSTSVVDQSMAAMLDSGSVAALSYGGKVISVVVGLGALALGTAVLPHFSEMVARRDFKSVRHTLRTYSKWIVIVFVPLTLVLLLTSEWLVKLLFERGEFTSMDTHVVARVQALYALQIPFYLLGILFVRLITALQRSKILMWGAVISLPLDIVLNLLFMRLFGVSGIALSTSVVYIISCLYLGVLVHRQLGSRIAIVDYDRS